VRPVAGAALTPPPHFTRLPVPDQPPAPPGPQVEDATFNAVLYCNRAAALQALGHHLDAVADCCVAAHLDGRYPRVLQVRVGGGVEAAAGPGGAEQTRCRGKAMRRQQESEPRAPRPPLTPTPGCPRLQRRAEAFSAIGDYGAAVADLQRLCELLAAPPPPPGGPPPEGPPPPPDAAALKEARGRLADAEARLAARGAAGVDHYAVLGITQAAGVAEVKAAYRWARRSGARRLLGRNRDAGAPPDGGRSPEHAACGLHPAHPTPPSTSPTHPRNTLS
jgi:hypothetical protein